MSDSTPQSKPKAAPNFSDLRTRVLSAIVMIAAAVGALWAGGVWFALFWLAAALAVNWEWQNLLGQPARTRMLAGAFGVTFAGVLAAQAGGALALIPLALAAFLCAALAPAGLRLWAGAGVLYAGLLAVSLFDIRPHWLGPLEPSRNLRAIIWLFAVVWGTDVGAYFGGRLIGGPKLWPRVSAGKTWSGAIAGALVGAGLGVAAGFLGKPVATSWVALALVGLVGSIISQGGDLFESAVKRRFGVKDSSQLIPGHGGVMDRLDGFIVAAIFVSLLGLARGVNPAEGLFIW